jgi:hypothetical protein
MRKGQCAKDAPNLSEPAWVTKGEADTISRRSASKFVKFKRAVSPPPVPQRSSPPLNQLDVESDPEVRAAFTKFFSDFVLVPKDRSLSRGYFDGLEHLLAKADLNSELFRATRIVTITTKKTVEEVSALYCPFARSLLEQHHRLYNPVKLESCSRLGLVGNTERKVEKIES